MTNLITALSITGVLMVGTAAFAEDPTTPPGTPPTIVTAQTPTPPTTAPVNRLSKRQLMKDCMDRQKATANGQSASELRKACKEQVRAQMQYSTVPAGP